MTKGTETISNLQPTQVNLEEELTNKQPVQLPPPQSSEKPLKQDQISAELSKFQGEECVGLDFQNICLDVKIPLGTKRILNNISGFVCPGEILYIMGPSGGGKTSLLDFLCNRTQKSPKKDVYLNGKKWSEKEFKKVARYCQQHPTLYEVLTVWETLEYAASFTTKDNEDRKERVSTIISLLGLENQKDTKIGGHFFRGISGGQKQRVSVGEQLVANPKLLFLDEPTSGLDSASAYQLMENLKQICRKTGITVVASIHQPSQRVFDISDRLMILAGGKGFGGNVAYFGKTKDIDQYFEQSGIQNHTKASTSEWVLDQVNGDFGETEQIQRILDYYNSSQLKLDIDTLGKDLQNQQEKYKYQGVNTKESYIWDILILLHRGFKTTIKNPFALLMRILVYCAMALVIGTVWWQTGDSPDAGDVMDINGVLFFASAFFTIMMISVLPTNIEDRHIMVKERVNGSYQLGAFSVGQFLVSVPVTFVVALVPGVIVYFMVGFEREEVFGFVLNLFLCLVASEGLIFIVANVFSHLLICIVIVAFVYGSFMIMNGFFIKRSNIPDGWIWLHYSAFNTYTFQNFMKGVYKDINIGKNLDIVPPAVQDFPGELVLKDLDMEDADEAVNVVVVIAFIIMFRIIAHTYSYFKHTGKK